MKLAPMLLVPFSEVRHDQPDDCLHYESVAERGAEMDWTIPAHRHEGLHQFQMLTQGSVRGSIDGRAFEAQGPVLLMLPPRTVHGFTYTREAVGHQVTVPTKTLLWLLGDAELVDKALGAPLVLQPTGQALAEVEGLFEQIAREFNASALGRVGALMSLATLLALCTLRLGGAQIEKERGAGARDTLVQRYLALIETHYTSQQPLEFYASALGVTPDHLSRSCRQAVARSALQILHERLMLEARRLLAYTPMPVTQVSEQLGYADPAYFTRFFTRAMGKTPSAYRQAVARGVNSPMESKPSAKSRTRA